MRGIVLCKSSDVEIVQDAGSVFNKDRKLNGGVGGKKSEWRCRREEVIYIVQFLRIDPYPVLCWFMNTKPPGIHLAQPPRASSMRSYETRWSTRGDYR